MNISNVLATEPADYLNHEPERLDPSHQQTHSAQNLHQYPTRHAMSQNYQSRDDGHIVPLEGSLGQLDNDLSLGQTLASPSSQSPKSVAFELLLDENQKTRARIPMRVNIFPHDTTDSIVTTVKNFYGIYEGASTGVSFEDENRNTLIARYENLRNNMTVFVRVIVGNVGNPYAQETYGQSPYYGRSPVDPQRRRSLGEPIQLPSSYAGPLLDHNLPLSRPTSRVTRKRSLSPHTNRGRRSASLNKSQSRLDLKSRASSTHGSFADANSDAIHGYSDSDGGHGSVTSSRKARSEMTADISLGNILQEGRRKRAKFESSELPLFAPPQVPLNTSTSSISPQRQSLGHEGPSPFARPTHRLSYQPLPPSPYSYGYMDQSYGNNAQQVAPYAPPPPVPQHGHRLRDRQNLNTFSQYPYTGRPGPSSQRILPTPDPTIASCISDEDVALQLMRLGDVSNMSHGRTSASTLNDDAFSGAADVASSTGATSEVDVETDNGELDTNDMKQYKARDNGFRSYEDSDGSGGEIEGFDEVDDTKEEAVSDEFDDYSAASGRPKVKKAKIKHTSSGSTTFRVGKVVSSSKPDKVVKQRSTIGPKKPKHSATSSNGKVPIMPTSTPSQSRKTSTASTLNFQHQLGVDEEDLSSKPRCRRCRKSKKGCDRQRPCQRCKDAGIGIEGCVSEEEENGRKGRYGRHMGVPVKKADGTTDAEDFQNVGAILTGMALPQLQAAGEKSKKRKR